MPVDFVVIGAGVFGAWTAWTLQRAGRSVLLFDAYGAANSRASSGGESRIIRMGYGSRRIYTEWSIRSLAVWREFAARTDASLLHPCGALWIAPAGDAFAHETVDVLRECSVAHDILDSAALRARFPQFRYPDSHWGIWEPETGGLMARRAIQTLAREVPYRQQSVRFDQGRAWTSAGEAIEARTLIFACGPWLPKLFPDVVGDRIVPSRQEVHFFGAPAGSAAYGPQSMPCWIDTGTKFYGLPDIENRGFKLAHDPHGPPVDPDTENRVASEEGIARARVFLRQHIPELAAAPLLEARVCQYENTASGDFLIDRHPEFDHVWLAGGGSGHAFKHGPAIGEYIADLVTGAAEPDPRFRLTAHDPCQGPAESSFYRH